MMSTHEQTRTKSIDELLSVVQEKLHQEIKMLKDEMLVTSKNFDQILKLHEELARTTVASTMGKAKKALSLGLGGNSYSEGTSRLRNVH